jgi:hypothetical protein
MSFVSVAFYEEHYIKGQCHEICDLRIFHQTFAPVPLIHALKPFEFCFEFAKILDYEIAEPFFVRQPPYTVLLYV